jgi:hypothetical protein
VQFHSTFQARPVFDLTGDRPLGRLAGEARVDEELVGDLDRLAHRGMVAFCYPLSNAPKTLIGSFGLNATSRNSRRKRATITA